MNSRFDKAFLNIGNKAVILNLGFLALYTVFDGYLGISAVSIIGTF